MTPQTRNNLERTLSHLLHIEGAALPNEGAASFGDKELLHEINGLLLRFNCEPFSEEEQRDFLYQ